MPGQYILADEASVGLPYSCVHDSKSMRETVMSMLSHMIGRPGQRVAVLSARLGMLVSFILPLSVVRYPISVFPMPSDALTAINLHAHHELHRTVLILMVEDFLLATPVCGIEVRRVLTPRTSGLCSSRG